MALTVAASTTVTVTVEVPAVVGVPEMTPVPALIVRPAGSPVADQLYGGVPPTALTVAEYAVAAVPAGSDAVVIASAARHVVSSGS